MTLCSLSRICCYRSAFRQPLNVTGGFSSGRWKLPGVPHETPAAAPRDTPEQAAAALDALTTGIERVLQDRNFVLPRITDPDLLAEAELDEEEKEILRALQEDRMARVPNGKAGE